MTSPGTNPTETWRILIVRHNGDEILVSSNGTNLILPEVTIPVQERIAANLNRAVEQELGLSVVSLYEVAPRRGSLADGIPCHAALAIAPGQKQPDGMRWRDIRSLIPNSFSRAEDFLAIEEFRCGLEARKEKRPAEPFLKPDWFTEVRSWVQDSLPPSSLQLTGAFRQLNASRTFSLIRFATNETPVWFKAVGEPNLREYFVTLALARLCPGYVSRIFASKPAWHAWLAAHAPGNSLLSRGEMQFWESSASSLANLQIATIGETRQLLEAGARDLRTATLLSSVDPFFQFIAECSRPKPPRAAGSLGLPELSERKAAVRLAIEELDRLGLLETVGHMDLNPANIFCGADRSVFIDWAEACVGCPVFSYEYLLQHFRRTELAEPLSEERLRSAYLGPWQRLLSPEDLERALVLSRLVALFGYAMTVWSSSPADISLYPSRQTYLLSLVRRMKSEAPRREAEKVRL